MTDELGDLLGRGPLADVSWSVLALDVDTGRELLRHDPERLLPTASLAKVFLLLETAEAFATGRVLPHFRVTQGETTPVADSGLWRHLDSPDLTLVDAAVLVGAVSDNLATNALLDQVGLDAVQRRAVGLAPYGSMLLDEVRDVRGPGTAPELSRGCAADWAPIAAGLARGELGGPGVSEQVVGWLSAGCDLSMVASAFDLDPLAHGPDDDETWLWCKTGTDPGVRADTGVATHHDRSVAWSVIASWDDVDAADTGTDLRGPVLATMRQVGAVLREELVSPRRPA